MFADSIVPDYEYDGPKSPTITQRSSEETSAEISDLAQLKIKCKQSKDGFKNRKIKTIECQKYSAALAKDSNFIQKNVNKIQDNQPVHYGSKDDPTFHCGNLIEGGFTELSLDECVYFSWTWLKVAMGVRRLSRMGLRVLADQAELPDFLHDQGSALMDPNIFRDFEPSSIEEFSGAMRFTTNISKIGKNWQNVAKWWNPPHL